MRQIFGERRTPGYENLENRYGRYDSCQIEELLPQVNPLLPPLYPLTSREPQGSLSAIEDTSRHLLALVIGPRQDDASERHPI